MKNKITVKRYSVPDTTKLYGDSIEVTVINGADLEELQEALKKASEDREAVPSKDEMN